MPNSDDKVYKIIVRTLHNKTSSRKIKPKRHEWPSSTGRNEILPSESAWV